MKFRVGDAERRKRKRNLLLGVALSLVLAGVIAFENARYPEQYNDVLFWSVVGFVVVANLVSAFRLWRYLRLVDEHYLELVPGELRFVTQGDESVLELENVAAMRLFRRGGGLQHIQLLLKSQRGVRLEGYEGLDELARQLQEQLPSEKMM